MTSLLKHNLHQMVDFAVADKVITACIAREDVCRFLLHSYMDYMTDHGLFDSSFEVLIDWSKQLDVHIDDKTWKVTKPSSTKPLFPSQSESNSSSLKGIKKSSIKKKGPKIKIKMNASRTSSKSVPARAAVTGATVVTPISDHILNDTNDTNDTIERDRDNSYSAYSKYKKLKTKTDAFIILRPRAKSHGNNLQISSTSPAVTPKADCNNEASDCDGSNIRERGWTADSEISEWNLNYQRKWSDDDAYYPHDPHDDDDTTIDGDRDSNSISIGDHEKNLIVTQHAKNILSNIDEDEKYSISRTLSPSYIDNTDNMVSLSRHNFLCKLPHSMWIVIAQFLNTASKAATLGLVNREMNLLCSHPLCWKKLCISIDHLTQLNLSVMRRSFKCLTRFELNWNNPETPLSLLYGGVGQNGNIYHINNRINGYMALKYTKEIELFFSNLSSVCNHTLHTFKLSQHGGPYRLANSAPTSIKIFQTETLLRLVFSNFTNLRKFKMDAYNLIAVDVFTTLLKKYSPKLQFFESQIVVYNRQTQRVILENPVLLNDVNILPSTLRHLCLPLLADDTWIINQHLPNLEYLFFFGYTRSSGYALHENFLSIRCLDYIAGQKSPFPKCPKIKIIEIALRQNDYLTIILRPIIRKLFIRCHYLQSVKLATAGNLDLAQNLYKSLYASKLAVCHVFAKDEGRPEKPIGVVEFRRNPNYKSKIHAKHLSVPNISEKEETVSEMAIGGRLRG